MYLCTEHCIISENQGDRTMDNQQERFELELAWLAGIIEGEGWISLALVKSAKRNGISLPAYVPNIGLVNTDLMIVEKAEELFKKLGLKYRANLRKAYIGPDGASRKEKKEISIATHENFKILAKAIYPYMVGEKRQRIEKVLKFIESRASKTRRGKNSKYTQEEHEIYLSLYSYRGKSRSKIPNDYTPGSRIAI